MSVLFIFMVHVHKTFRACPLMLSDLHSKWRYIIVVSLVCIAFVVVKLKMLKVLHTDPTSRKWPFLGGFWTLSPPNMVQYCWNSHQGSCSFKQKKKIENFLKYSSFYGKGTDPKLAFLVELWPPISPRRWTEIKKKQ